MKSWNEIRKAATAFSKRWKNAYDEKAQAQRGRERGDIALCDASPKNSKKLCGLRSSATLREKKVRLEKFHEKIASLTFLDPACGCGNFLLIAYRELRRLEMDVLEELHRDDPGQFLDISQLCKVSVSQFYGIEIEQFPAEIAKVALWLMDHLCNMEVADRFGQYFARIPIKDSPHIVCANALRIDWSSLLNASVKCKMESVKLQEANQAPNFTLYTLHSICAAAQMVLDARAAHPNATLADLYDPLTMPPDLVKAHAHLDALVDKAYGLSPSCTDADRVAHLFKLYAEKVK